MLVLRLFQWRKGKRMEKFSADYAGKCMTGSIMCVKADDAEVAIAAARKQGAKREREEILDYLTCMAPGVGTARDAARYIKSRGSSEPRCTCWDGTKGCTEHAPDCPCYKPDPKCTCGMEDYWYTAHHLHYTTCPCYKPPEKGCHVCRCGGSSFCHCSCHKPPEITPLGKLRDDGSYDPPIVKAINALVDAVNELREKK